MRLKNIIRKNLQNQKFETKNPLMKTLMKMLKLIFVDLSIKLTFQIKV